MMQLGTKFAPTGYDAGGYKNFVNIALPEEDLTEGRIVGDSAPMTIPA